LCWQQLSQLKSVWFESAEPVAIQQALADQIHNITNHVISSDLDRPRPVFNVSGTIVPVGVAEQLSAKIHLSEWKIENLGAITTTVEYLVLVKREQKRSPSATI
jgi:hypothetical protein